ncbi:glycosyltransferase family 9 protein [Actinomadura roseirufa]|uniref:glycosyltransferase family 9 protein n=1 Tax=Actinomadura roseirufa TaxID=2094049 RepID=UPI001040E473|nr:glycosyltransferase family 9 protein [Actinomadura roseirufa]
MRPFSEPDPGTAAAADGRAAPRRRALVVLNSGLGNSVMSAPLLAVLGERLNIDCTVLGLPLPGDLLPSLNPARPVAGEPGLPPLWRRFRPRDWDDILAFLHGRGIDLVINLRKHDPAKDGAYFAFRDRAAREQITCWDLHAPPGGGGGPQPFAREAMGLFRRHAGDLPDGDWRWLAGTRRPPEQPVAGLFLGASTSLKRWTVRSWAGLVGQLRAARPSLRISVSTGAGEEEIALLDELVARCAPGAFEVRHLAGVDELVRWVGSLSVLVTGDTATVHIAAAQGVPGVGLYFSTLASIWGPGAAAPGFTLLQSPIGRLCPGMQVNGTCTRMYTGCPAPCRLGIGVRSVRSATLERLERAGAGVPARSCAAGRVTTR